MGENWFNDAINYIFDIPRIIVSSVDNAIYYAEKNVQREVWQTGSQLILRDLKKYYTSAWLLEHSLQDNPNDVWRGNDSRIAYLINNDPAYLDKLDNAIQASKDGKINQNLEGIAFNSGDLYYSIHLATIHVEGYKQNNGKWIIHAQMKDTYDFTVIQSFMSDEGGYSMKAGLGTIANDLAVFSQDYGAISPYNITVDFYTTR